MTQDSQPTPKPSIVKEARQRQLIDATISTIGRVGYSGTTLNHVAGAAGLSPGIVNFYFKSKDQLLAATLAQLAEEHESLWLAKIAAAGGSPEGGLDAMIEAYDKASSMEEIVRLARQIQAWLHEDAAFIPAFVEPFYRTTYWRWVKWPRGFNGKTSRDADEFMMFWVDAEERDRTKAALARGESFPVQTPVFDAFKLPDR